MERSYASIVRGALKEKLSEGQLAAIARLEEKETEFDGKVRELEALKSALDDKAAKLAETQALLEAERIENAKRIATFQRQYAGYLELEKKFNALNDKVATSYSTQDISSYLNQIIRDFNQSTESDSEIATYVINSMDVDLKVRIYGEDKDTLRFTAPSITETTEDSLSSIKISIQAVPK